MVLRDDINNLRTCDLRAFEKKQAISEGVIDFMREKGRFVKSTGGELFWFQSEGSILFEMNSRQWEAHLSMLTGLNPTEKEYQHLKVEIEHECIRNGELEEISRLSRYDYDEKAIYLYLGQGAVVKLTGGEIERTNNGCGCLFVEDEFFEPVNPILDGKDELEEILNLGGLKDTYISPKEIDLLRRSLLFGTFVPDSLTVKPLIHFLGPQGSGKTSAQRLIGLIIYGGRFQVIPRPNKEDAFNAAVCSSSYLAIDNLTKCSPWLEERLKTISTGTIIPLRKLYTTNEMVTFLPNCIVSLSSIDYPFSDATDTLSRLIIFETKKPLAYVPDKEIKDRVLAARNRIWGQVLVELNKVLSLRLSRKPFTSSSRLADFFQLVSNVAEVQGQQVDMTSLINRMEQQRLTARGQDDAVLDGLLKIAPNISGRNLSAKELCDELAKAGVTAEPISLGKRLPDLKFSLKSLGYDLHIEETRSNRKLYQIERSEAKTPVDSEVG